MGNFGKNEDCPPSQELLAFQNGDIPVSESADLRKHLAVCEFCSAEVEFYERYPQMEESADTPASPEMPEPLRELAVALLGGHSSPNQFERLVRDSDLLLLDDR
jgi:hypothetical protein